MKIPDQAGMTKWMMKHINEIDPSIPQDDLTI